MITAAPMHRRAALRSLASACTGAFVAIALLTAPRAAVAQAAAGPSLVVLVRHGEKATENPADPSLSAAGQERAKALLDAMTNMAPSAILVSATKRTAETAAPLAAKYAITPQVISLAGGGAAHVAAVADAVRKQHGVVVIVGHSNTVPAIIKALGGPALPDICDASYAGLYVLQPSADGKSATLLRGTYGAADAAGATSCGAMR